MGAKYVFLIRPAASAQELDQMPDALPEQGFLWLAFEREQFVEHIGILQQQLHQLIGLKLLDLHVSDLRNVQLPSHFDYTSNYDMLVFRRLSPSPIDPPPEAQHKPDGHKTGMSAVRKLSTAPVGFVVFDRVVISVHPQDCAVLQVYVERLKMLGLTDAAQPVSAAGVPVGPARLPDSPAELMLRVVGLIVDDYLDLRRGMTRQLDRWQQRLLRPDTRFDDWETLLQSRQALHHLYDICEDQRGAISRWMDILEDWPKPANSEAQHRHDQLMVRSRDVMEHIERVSHHVRMLEQSAETTVQIHFNIQSSRTNDVMRTLTAITAVFLPLNLIAGIFGMNFEFIPWLHSAAGFWGSLAVMGLIAFGLIGYFARKRYLSSDV